MQLLKNKYQFIYVLDKENSENTINEIKTALVENGFEIVKTNQFLFKGQKFNKQISSSTINSGVKSTNIEFVYYVLTGIFPSSKISEVSKLIKNNISGINTALYLGIDKNSNLHTELDGVR